MTMSRWVGLLLIVPFTALADTSFYCIEPDLEIPNATGRLEKINRPLIRTDAQNEVEACNQAIYLIGTFISEKIDAIVCTKPFPGGKELCRKTVFRSAKVTGGSIARASADCTTPEFFSRVNEATNSTDRQLRLCRSQLSWDPMNAEKNSTCWPVNEIHSIDLLRHTPRKMPFHGNLSTIAFARSAAIVDIEVARLFVRHCFA